MASSMVTIEKGYFETLLRRAQFHTAETDLTLPTVTIKKSDYEGLVATAHKYENLERNLYRGGITDDIIKVLTQGDAALSYDSFVRLENETAAQASPAPLQRFVDAKKATDPGAQHIEFRDSNNYAPRDDHPPVDNNASQSCSAVDEWDHSPDGPSDGPEHRGPSNNTRPARQYYEKFAKRSIHLTNLLPTTSHVDVAEAVRGGLLLDLYLRSERFTNGKTASISFLEESQAREFFQYVKNSGLFIRGKRVGIRWSDRQFILPGFVANKISGGATRNLVIHNRDPNETERSIREDLEHIHNLVIVKITFRGSDAYISTNSVHNALFARTCMMSRGKYKSCRIEWYPDECAAPFEPRPQVPTNDAVPKKKFGSTPMNRFQILDTDDVDDEAEGSGELDDKPVMSDNSFAASFEGLE